MKRPPTRSRKHPKRPKRIYQKYTPPLVFQTREQLATKRAREFDPNTAPLPLAPDDVA